MNICIKFLSIDYIHIYNIKYILIEYIAMKKDYNKLKDELLSIKGFLSCVLVK